MKKGNRTKLKPFQQFAWAIFFWLGAVAFYREFARLEAAGTDMRLRGLSGTLYEVGGKWGVPGLFAFVGTACFWYGFVLLRRDRQ